MKAKFFLLGLCALALAACSIDEVSQVNDTNAIQFKATTATRVAATTTNNLQEFTVWAWNGTNLFMDGVTASKSGSVFTTSPLYFWPTGSVDFYALTEVVEHGIFTDDYGSQHEYALLGGQINESGDGWTYTGNVAKAQVDNGSIVIDACIPSTPEEQIDICYGVALEKSSGSVPMNFRHALSQIAFKAKNTNTAFDVKIADVSVCSVYSEGTYTIGKNDTSDNLATSDLGTGTITNSQGSWKIIEKDEYEVPIKSRYLVNMESNIVQLDTEGTVEELVDPEGVLMLLPQEVVGWDPLTDAHDGNLGAYIRILCHVEESGSQLWPNNVEEEYDGNDANFKTINDVEYAEIAIPLEDVEWEQGYRYTYTIVFGEGLGYYPPDDPNWELDGTPVLVPITFNVTVDEFQDAEGVDVKTDTDLSYIEVSSYEELVGALRMGYEVIDVVDSFALEDDIYVNNNCTINIKEGVTITDAEIFINTTCTVNIEEGASVVAYNDPDKGATAAFWVADGTLTINSEGTVTTTGGSESENTMCVWVRGVDDGANAAVIINGGEYYGSDWAAATDSSDGNGTIYVQKGFAYIYDGEFYGAYCKTFKEVSILNCYDSNRSNGTAWIYVYGGDFYSFDPASNNAEDGTKAGLTNFCAEGYSTVYDETTDCYTVILTTVATPADLTAALAAGASEITVSESFSIVQGGTDDNYGYFRVYNDCTIVLEDGVTISLDPMGSVANYGFFVVNSGTLTVEGNGTLKSNGATNDMGAMCFWVDGGNVVINGGNFYSAAWAQNSSSDTAACVYVNQGTATINGGSFYGSHNVTAYSGSSYLLNCTDKNYKADPRTADIICYGGAFCDFDPADNYAEGEGTSFVAEGYQSVKSESPDSDGWYWYTVVEGN